MNQNQFKLGNFKLEIKCRNCSNPFGKVVIIGVKSFHTLKLCLTHLEDWVYIGAVIIYSGFKA